MVIGGVQQKAHYLFDDRFGRPGKGNDKGKVEGLVGYVRRNFLVPIPSFANFEALNTYLEQRCLTLLDDAETRGNINADETDELDKTDLILTADGPTDYILAEISITIQQHDVDRAAHRAALLAQATGQTVTPFAFGTQEEPGINRRDVQITLIPEPTDD